MLKLMDPTRKSTKGKGRERKEEGISSCTLTVVRRVPGVRRRDGGGGRSRVARWVGRGRLPGVVGWEGGGGEALPVGWDVDGGVRLAAQEVEAQSVTLG